ncbi:hypothetical protein NQZ68_036189 [Dissostichus eleginoides]|nr:hypothetical protein NQZ68_036189 [Dissostichus eleginoides]
MAAESWRGRGPGSDSPHPHGASWLTSLSVRSLAISSTDQEKTMHHPDLLLGRNHGQGEGGTDYHARVHTVQHKPKVSHITHCFVVLSKDPEGPGHNKPHTSTYPFCLYVLKVLAVNPTKQVSHTTRFFLVESCSRIRILRLPGDPTQMVTVQRMTSVSLSLERVLLLKRCSDDGSGITKRLPSAPGCTNHYSSRQLRGDGFG